MTQKELHTKLGELYNTLDSNLANGKYSSSFDNLDISIPTDRIASWTGSDANRPGTYMYSLPSDGSTCTARAADGSKLPVIQANFLHRDNDQDSLLCFTFSDGSANSIADQICQSLARSSFVNENNGYRYYILR